MRCWRFDSHGQTLLFVSRENRLPELTYWGAPLPENENLEELARALAPPVGGGMLDNIVPVTLCPTEGDGFMGQPGLAGCFEDSSGWAPDFQLANVQQEADRLHFQGRDSVLDLVLNIHLQIKPGCGTVTLSSQLCNHGKQAYRLENLAAATLLLPAHMDWVHEFGGKWCREFESLSKRIDRGPIQRQNRTGRTGHGDFPGLILTAEGCSNLRGEALGLHLAWSGGHRHLVERMADGRTYVQMGPMLRPGEIHLGPGETFETPDIHLCRSEEGIGGIARAFHETVRALVTFPDQEKERPVNYNCWEAVYFDHDLEELKQIASIAADLGAERFVLDDGWFKGRTDDRRALGDWSVDSGKYPEGLTPLINHMLEEGMAFGLWVEPEMVNPDSDLYRAHPDWILAVENADQLEGRHQLVLDLSRQEVTNYLFDVLDALLSQYEISYLKWDHNRVLTQAGNGGSKPSYIAQTRALYALLDRLRQAHPEVEIESCASGGGRVDLGILEHTHRVWLSDSNDAHERQKIQHHALPFLPPEVTGSHVGPRDCHTSGRRLSMSFRAWTAAQRHMGFEMDPRELDAEETACLKKVVAWYKENRSWLHRGQSYLLDSPLVGQLAEMTLAQQGDRFAVISAQLEAAEFETVQPLRLAGLEANSRYRLRLTNPEDIKPNLCRDWTSPLGQVSGLVLSGSALMQVGVILPISHPDHVWVLEGEKLDE